MFGNITANDNQRLNLKHCKCIIILSSTRSIFLCSSSSIRAQPSATEEQRQGRQETEQNMAGKRKHIDNAISVTKNDDVMSFARQQVNDVEKDIRLCTQMFPQLQGPTSEPFRSNYTIVPYFSFNYLSIVQDFICNHLTYEILKTQS